MKQWESVSNVVSNGEVRRCNYQYWYSFIGFMRIYSFHNYLKWFTSQNLSILESLYVWCGSQRWVRQNGSIVPPTKCQHLEFSFVHIFCHETGSSVTGLYMVRCLPDVTFDKTLERQLPANNQSQRHLLATINYVLYFDVPLLAERSHPSQNCLWKARS